MSRIPSLFLIASIILASNGLGKSEIAYQNESLHEAEDISGSSRLFEHVFISLVECVREKIKGGFPPLKIKTFDPYQARIPFFLPFIRNPYLSGTLLLRKLRIEGLSGFELKQGTVTIRRQVKFRLNFSKIKITSRYKAKLKLFGFMNIYGKGTFSIVLNNIDINTQVRVRTLPRVRFEDLFLNVTLPTMDAVVTGLLNDEYMSDLISQQLTDTWKTLVEEEHTRFNAVLYTVATYLIDSKINSAGLRVDELLDLLGGLTGNCGKYLADIAQTALPLIMEASGIDTDAFYSGDYRQFEDDDF